MPSCINKNIAFIVILTIVLWIIMHDFKKICLGIFNKNKY
jgi:hypothetical protein